MECDRHRSPALTISKVVLSLRSMLASCTDKRRPDGDQMCACLHRTLPAPGNGLQSRMVLL